MSIRMSATTSLLKYYPLPEALRTIAEAGYQGVELWGGLPHGYPLDFYVGDRLDQDIIERTKGLLKASGLERVLFLPEQCFYPVNFLVEEAPPFDGARLRRRSIEYFERAIEVAGALEFPKMLITTPFWGWKRSGDHFRHSYDKPLDAVAEVIGNLVEHAERHDVELILEPLTHLETTGVETLDDLVHVLDAVGSSSLAAMVDTGHVHVTASKLGIDSLTYFRRHVDLLGPRLKHLHINDNLGDTDAHLLPGEGTFDFAGAYACLRESGYGGFLSAELIMFGANPVPPAPLQLLRTTRERTLGAWNG